MTTRIDRMSFAPKLFAFALGAAAGLAGCSRDEPRVRVVRLATDEAIAESSARADSGPRSLRLVDDVRGHDRWSFDLASEADTNIDPHARLKEAGETALLLPRGVSAAVWLETGGSSILEIEAMGSFAAKKGLLFALWKTSSPPTNPGGVWPTGALKKLLDRVGLGRPQQIRITGDGIARSRAEIMDAARGVLLTVTNSGRDPARVERVVVRAVPQLDWMKAHDRISDRGVASIKVGGFERPALVVATDAPIVTRELALPADAALRFSFAAVDDPGGGEAIVEVLHGAEPLARWSRETAGSSTDWLEVEVPITADPGTPVSVRFTYRAPTAADARSFVAIGAPMLASTGPRDQRPNVLLVSLDTLRDDRVGMVSARGPVTPALDELTAAGTRFAAAYSSAPYTLPSHGSLLSGLFPETHGLENATNRIRDGVPMLAEQLADVGYETTAFTAGGYLSARFGFIRGFDRYCEIDPIGDWYATGRPRTTESFPDGSVGALPHVIASIERERTAPFFMFVHTYMAHDFLPPRDLADAFDLPQPLTFETSRRFTSFEVRDRGLSAEETDFMRRAYDATAAADDRMIGELLAALDRAGLADDTIVIVTSDHGEELYERGGAGHGITLYDEVVRIPLIVKGPGVRPGHVVDERVRHVDVVPTLLEQLGLAAPSGIQGESFAAALRGDAIRSRPIPLSVLDPPRSVRQGWIENDWKLIDSIDDEKYAFRPGAATELYHLAVDPAETANVAESNSDMVTRLRRRIAQHRDGCAKHGASFGDSVERALPPEVEAHLRELGYLQGN